MIKFTRIRIQDYKSIQDTSLEIEAGLYKVVGDSQGYSSNGAGKTTLVQAITLGLFNRDFAGAKVDEVCNRITGKAFIITIDFTKEEDAYKLVNNRRRKTMFLYHKGELLCNGYASVQKKIIELLGMGYETFCLTHFITSRTVNHITENLSNPNLFNDILQIAQLKELDKKFLALAKEVKAEQVVVQKELNAAEAVASTLALTKRFDKDILKADLLDIKRQLTKTTLHNAVIQKEHSPSIANIENKLAQNVSDLNNIIATISSGICPTCSTLLVGKSEVSVLKTKEELVEEEIDSLRTILEKKQAIWDVISKELLATTQDIRNKKKDIEAELRIAEEITLASVDLTSKSPETIQKELAKVTKLLRYVYYTREQIKEGKVVQELLDSFFSIVSSKLTTYSALINMNGIYVEVTTNKLGMGISLYRDDTFVPIATLSNGEKTRLSLLVLISMLSAMKEVSNAETNYLVFDEASSSFDASGIEELEALFNYMKSMGQACFVITHGQEMAKVSFDKEVIVSKIEGISTCRVTNI